MELRTSKKSGILRIGRQESEKLSKNSLKSGVLDLTKETVEKDTLNGGAKAILNPNGTKSYRYSDKVEVVEGEVTKIYQAGKVSKNGLPITRESKAIEDIMNSIEYNGAPIYFIPYNSNMGPIIYLP